MKNAESLLNRWPVKKTVIVAVFGIVAVVLWGILACLALEVFLRFKGAYVAKAFIVGESGWNIDIARGIAPDLIPSNNPGLAWELKPKDILNKYDRFSRQQQPKPAGTYRIVAIGDSITQQGYYERFLEQDLNARGSQYRFEVWNCGVSGYDITNYYYYLKERALRFRPDLIILGFCLDDFDSTMLTLFTGERYLEFHNPFIVIPFPFSRYLFLHSHLYRGILSRLEAWRLRESTMDAVLEAKLDGIIEICSRRGIGVVAIIWPYLKNTYRENENREYQRIKAILAERKVPWIDLHGVLKDRDDPSLRLHKDEYIHPSEKGFAIMTRDGIYPFVAAYLKARGVH